MDNSINPEAIRITIKWTDLLLSLGACAGNLVIEEIDLMGTFKSKILMTARVKVEKSSHGYENAQWFNGLTYQDFESHIYPTVTIMMRSYHKGMSLTKLDYEWIEKWNAQSVKEENSPEWSDTQTMDD